jgi:5-methylcytosine-specific restriction endonuclease McrA
MKLTPEELLERKRARNRAYMKRWRLEHPDEAKERNKKYREANPEKVSAGKKRCYERRKAHYLMKSNQWKESNREFHDAYHRNYRQTEWQRFADAQKRYRQRHPEKDGIEQRRIRRYRRRALMAKVDWENFTREEIFVRDGGICWLCGLKVDEDDWHLDHKIPIVKGGPHTRSNVAVSHPTCNHRKYAKIL